MLISRISNLSGITHELDIPISEDELLDLELNESSEVWDRLDVQESEFLLEGTIQSEYLERFEE
jgi:hypothetical protein